MRFQVPQFIEHEPKVIGPFTFRQFIYLGVPGAVAFFLYFLAPFYVFIAISILLGAGGFAFAFVKIGGRNLPTVFLNIFQFAVQPKQYRWRQKSAPAAAPQLQAPQQQAQQAAVTPKREVKLVQQSRLKDLSTRVETQK